MSILSAGYRAVTLAVPCVVIPGETMEMTLDEFEQLTNEVFDGLPAEAVDGLDNVAFVVEDRPKDGSLGLLGLYEGHDRFARAEYGYGQLPDVIVIYCAPILAICDSAEQRSEERRVGKECRSRWSRAWERKKGETWMIRQKHS